MKAVLRIASLLSIIGFVALMLLTSSTVRSAVNASPALAGLMNVGGAVAAVASFVAWFGAIYHWGTRFPTAGRRRAGWGLGVILGVFVGAWLYAFFGIASQQGATDRR